MNDPAENRLGKGRKEEGERTEGKKERECLISVFAAVIVNYYYTEEQHRQVLTIDTMMP